MDTLFISTAIPFVNGPPHLGHALEYVQADVLARHARAPRPVGVPADRHRRACGEERAARRPRRAPRCRSSSPRTRRGFASWPTRCASPTTTSSGPAPTLGTGPSSRSSGGERRRAATSTAPATRAGTAPGARSSGTRRVAEHDGPLEAVAEENWFFRLSRYAPAIRELIAGGRLRIEPAERRNEVLGFLAGDVRDLSVSPPAGARRRLGDRRSGRSRAVDLRVVRRARELRAARPDSSGGPRRRTRRHVIGKGILRFHAVIWPAILLSAGVQLPDEILVHDYVTAGGRKIGKSLGNAIDPIGLVERYGADALRWWFAREVPRVGETDFSEARLVATADRDLAHGIGNLVQRVVALGGARRCPRGDTGRPTRPLGSHCRVARAGRRRRARHLRSPARASGAIVDAVADVNRFVEQTQPWSLGVDDARPIVGAALWATAHVVDELAPFVPDLAARARARLATLEPGPPLVAHLATRLQPAQQLSEISAPCAENSDNCSRGVSRRGYDAARAFSQRRRAMTRRHSVSSAPSKIESTRASTKKRDTGNSSA